MRSAALLLLVLAACDRPVDEPTPRPTTPPTPGGLQGLEPGADPGPAPRAAGDGRIAFVRDGTALWTMNPDGSDAKLVVPADGQAWLGHPAWSPNRKWIAFAWDSKGEINLHPRNLFIVKPDGTGLRQVTPLPRAGENLAGGPSAVARGSAVALLPGGRLGLEGFPVTAGGAAATARTGPGGRFEIAVPATAAWVKVAGEHQGVRYSGSWIQVFKPGEVVSLGEVLLTPDGSDDRAEHPAWTPSGTHLVYLQASPPAPPSTPRRALRRIRLDGAEGVQLFAEPDGGLVGGPLVDAATSRIWARHWNGRATAIDPASRQPADREDWGPVGRGAAASGPGGRIAVLRKDPTADVERIVLRDGTTIHERPAGELKSFDWSPDGKALVLEAGGALWRLDPATKETKELGPGGDPAWGGR